MTATHGLTSKLTASATSPGSDAIGGGFTSLNPADGLFLRAEHLARMQHYASDLATAVGAGLGPGVAYGFTCTLSDDYHTVRATPGLAFAAGRPLRSTVNITAPLPDVDPADDDFWVVEIVPASWLYGSEPVYGGLCEDPCGNGSGIRPFAAEGVELRLRPDSLADFGEAQDRWRRNRLASKYFEREREYGGEAARSPNAPWLLPDTPGGPVDEITGRPWSDGTGPHSASGVPLGVVWKDGDEWHLDVWTARRDLGDPTPMAGWQWRLGWRPRSVFMAQVLQFQAQLAETPSAQVSAQTPAVKKVLELISGASEKVAKIQSRKAADVTTDLEEVRQVLGAGKAPSLYVAGFEELPPGGYLPVHFNTLEEAINAAPMLFGNEVDVRVRACRADYIAHAVEQVQHVDRIPLVNGRGTPKVDMLVPLELADLYDTRTDEYGWAAFVRRRDELEPQRRDDVEVYLWEPDLGEGHVAFANRLVAAEPQLLIQQLEHLGTVSYPADEWGVPVDDDATWRNVHDRLNVDIGVIAVAGRARTPERQALAAARASLFVAPAVPPANNRLVPVQLPPTYVIVQPEMPEAIAIVLGRRPDQ
jgi:hypothetical protein